MSALAAGTWRENPAGENERRGIGRAAYRNVQEFSQLSHGLVRENRHKACCEALGTLEEQYR